MLYGKFILLHFQTSIQYRHENGQNGWLDDLAFNRQCSQIDVNEVNKLTNYLTIVGHVNIVIIFLSQNNNHANLHF